MKTTRENKTRLFLMAICLVGVMVTSSCSKDGMDAVNCATKGKNCDKFDSEDSYFKEEKITTDSTAVSKLSVRIEIEK